MMASEEFRKDLKEMEENLKRFVLVFNRQFNPGHWMKPEVEQLGINDEALANYLGISTYYLDQMFNGLAEMPEEIEDEISDLMDRAMMGLSLVGQEERQAQPPKIDEHYPCVGQFQISSLRCLNCADGEECKGHFLKARRKAWIQLHQ
jgi:hypothetical protein